MRGPEAVADGAALAEVHVLATACTWFMAGTGWKNSKLLLLTEFKNPSDVVNFYSLLSLGTMNPKP